jgi:nitrate reductase alpha subunit
MTHVTRARRQRGAKFAVIDVYRTPTVEAADIALIVKPGTDAALALAMMNVLFSEGMADRDYLARYTDLDESTEHHILTRTPAWAAAITGLAEQDIIDFARLHAHAQWSGCDARRLMPAGSHRRVEGTKGAAHSSYPTIRKPGASTPPPSMDSMQSIRQRAFSTSHGSARC